jgi:hypothetical protein
MKKVFYLTFLIVVASIAFVAGRISTPGYLRVIEFSKQLKEVGMTPTEVLDMTRSIRNHDEWGRQMAALVSVRALRFIEEEKLDEARKILTIPIASFYNDYSKKSQDPMTPDIIQKTKETALVSPTLQAALENE